MRSATESGAGLTLPSETVLRILRNHCGPAAGLEETLVEASKHIITGLQLFEGKKDRSQVVKAILMSLDLPLQDGAVLRAMAMAIASEVSSVKSMVRAFALILCYILIRVCSALFPHERDAPQCEAVVSQFCRGSRPSVKLSVNTNIPLN